MPGTLADSLAEALDTLHSAKQNCVLAIPSAGEGEGDIGDMFAYRKSVV